MKDKIYTERGLTKWIVIIIIGLIILAYLGVDVRHLWNSYIKVFLLYIWDLIKTLLP